MRPRLIPDGFCWCGCGATVGLGSFFKQGHDRAAEKRIIMQDFGSSAQFVNAFARGPNGGAKLLSLQEGATVVIEFINRDDRHGPYLRTTRDIRFRSADDGVAHFRLEGHSQFSVPLIDVLYVYPEGTRRVVRVHGAIDVDTSGQLGDVFKFTPFAR